MTNQRVKTWSEYILEYHFNLNPDIPLPEGVSWLYPFEDKRTKEAMQEFYSKFYSDTHTRILLLGINPGRFGAGITGVAFTDPVRLANVCGITNDFKKRTELSSIFVYDCIESFGGTFAFYDKFYINSICPLGFLKEGKNYNYYDSKALQTAVLPLIKLNIETHLEFGSSRDICVCLGKGKNFKFLKNLNAEKGYFKKVIPLPHPRWVMQYRLKRKDEFLGLWLDVLKQC